MIKKYQNCFENISATKARIFMKFYVAVNYYLVSLSMKFHKDPCTNADARVINARTRDKTCAHAFTTFVRTSSNSSNTNAIYKQQKKQCCINYYWQVPFKQK